MLAAVWVLPLTVISTGSCRYFVDSRRICAGMVAENSATCLSSGVSARIVSTSSANPMLSISSASSRTRNRSSVEVEGALLEVVHDPAGGADDDVDAAAQRGQLDAVPLAAVDRQHLDAGRAGGVLLERLAHLERQLAGGGEHERLRGLLRQVQPGEDRQRERRGLAGAGLRETDHVAAGHQRRDRGRLDRGGRLVAHAGDRAEHGPGEPEVGEGLLVRLSACCSPVNGRGRPAGPDSPSRWAGSPRQTRSMSVMARAATLWPPRSDRRPQVEHRAQPHRRRQAVVRGPGGGPPALGEGRGRRGRGGRPGVMGARRRGPGRAACGATGARRAGRSEVAPRSSSRTSTPRSRPGAPCASGTTRQQRCWPGCTTTPSWQTRLGPPDHDRRSASASVAASGSRPTSTSSRATSPRTCTPTSRTRSTLWAPSSTSSTGRSTRPCTATRGTRTGLVAPDRLWLLDWEDLRRRRSGWSTTRCSATMRWAPIRTIWPDDPGRTRSLAGRLSSTRRSTSAADWVENTDPVVRALKESAVHLAEGRRPTAPSSGSGGLALDGLGGSAWFSRLCRRP